MAGTESFVAVAADGSGKKVDAFQVTDDLGNALFRQVVVIGDAATLGGIVEILNGRMKVDGSGVVQPVSIAAPLNIENWPTLQNVSGQVAASQSGAWSVGVNGPVSISNVSDIAAALSTSSDGTDATGVSPLAGGAGQRGWLSSIYKLWLDVYSALGTSAVKAVTVQGAASGVPLPVAISGTDATGVSPLSGGAGLAGWLSSLYKILADVKSNLGASATNALTVQGAANGVAIPTTKAPVATWAPNVASVSTTAMAATIAARTGRKSIVMKNPAAASAQVFVSAVATNAGASTTTLRYALDAGEAITLESFAGAVFAFVATGTGSLEYWETY